MAIIEPVALVAREFGAGPPVVILHGLLGSGRNWQSIAKLLAGGHQVILPDLRNHGRSPWSHEMSYPAMASDLAALLDARGLASAAFVGHSMGGKAAMALALLHPERVARLAVIDIAPVIYDRATFETFIAAMRALPPELLARRADADLALAAAVPDAAVRAFLLQNLSPSGHPGGWQPNLAALAETMPILVGFPRARRLVRRPGAVPARRAVGLCAGRAPARDPAPVPACPADHRPGSGALGPCRGAAGRGRRVGDVPAGVRWREPPPLIRSRPRQREGSTWPS